jgi:hypothetical protein
MSEQYQLPRATNLEELFLSREFGRAPSPHTTRGDMPAAAWSPNPLRGGTSRPFFTFGVIGSAAALAVGIGLSATWSALPSGRLQVSALGSSSGARSPRPEWRPAGGTTPVMPGSSAGAKAVPAAAHTTPPAPAGSDSRSGASVSAEATGAVQATLTVAVTKQAAPTATPSPSPTSSVSGASGDVTSALSKVTAPVVTHVPPADEVVGSLTTVGRSGGCHDKACSGNGHSPDRTNPAPPVGPLTAPCGPPPLPPPLHGVVPPHSEIPPHGQGIPPAGARWHTGDGSR